MPGILGGHYSGLDGLIDREDQDGYEHAVMENQRWIETAEQRRMEALRAKKAKHRVNVDLLPPALARLDALAKETGQSYSTIVRQCLSLYDYLHARVMAGDSVLLKDKSGDLTELALPVMFGWICGRTSRAKKSKKAKKGKK